MAGELNHSSAGGLAGDCYEITMEGRAPLRCRVPTLADVAKLTLLDFRMARLFDADATAETRADAEAAQLELYELLPRALGLDPEETRLLPREVARILRDFFVRSRIPAPPKPPAPAPVEAEGPAPPPTPVPAT